MTDYYKISLEILIQLLHGEGYEFWEKWLLEDIRLWKTDNSTEHHLRAYGGNGSFNDVVFGENGTKSIWKRKIFGTVQTLAYCFAKGEISTIPLEESFYSYGSTQINGWRCRDCGEAKITPDAIENYISTIFLPKIFVEYIKKDKLIEIGDLEKIINSEEVSRKRQEIANVIQNSSVELSNLEKWLWTCPKCQSKETCAYRWYLNEDETQILEANDNLEMNS